MHVLCYPATSCPLSLLHEVDWKRAKLVFAVLYCRPVSIAIIARIYIYTYVCVYILLSYIYICIWSSLIAQLVKNLPAMQETPV